MNSPELRLSGSQSGSDNIITFSEVRPLKTLNNILRSIIYILGGGALLFITYLNLTGTAFMPLTDAELVSFETDNVLFYLVLMTVLACIISFGFFSFRNPHGFFPKSGVMLFFITVVMVVDGIGTYDIPSLFGPYDTFRTNLTLMMYMEKQAFAGSYAYDKASAASLILLAIYILFSSVIYFTLIRDKDEARLKKLNRQKEKELARSI